jgi:glycosyltransferase involved in cell wall biosynthesis
VNQTYKNIELIVVDDGSSDSSPEILKRLQQQYGFELFVQKNCGVSATLNWAIRNRSKGAYLAGCASDDFLLPDRIERQVQFMETHAEYAMVCGKVKVVDAQSNVVEGFNIIDTVENPEQDLKFESLLERNCIPAMTTMLRREIWDECGGYNESTPLEDFDMWLKVAYKHKIGYIDEYLACYRWHGENVTANSLKMARAVWNIIYSWRTKLSPTVANRILERRCSLSFSILSRNHKLEALKFLGKIYPYADLSVMKNYAKGFIKLLFYWKKNNNSYWK